jgi:hypothetical protein
MFLFVQNLFDSSLSIFSLAIYLSMLGYSIRINYRFVFLIIFREICFKESNRSFVRGCSH